MSSRRILLVSPGWPRAAFANGIVSYVDNMIRGFASHGAEARVAAWECLAGGDDAEPIRGAFGTTSPLANLAVRAAWKLAPAYAKPTLGALDAVTAVRRVHERWPFDLVEMEESLGWARRVARALPVPVVVRLHGPWFLNGAVLGAPPDAVFARRVTLEGDTIARAEAVTSPSKDVLERVRSHYGLELRDARVIPNPGPQPDPASQWRPEKSERGLVLFIGRFDRHKGGDLVIDAVSRLASRHPEVRLAFAGRDDGVVDDSGRRWSLPEYVAARFPPERRGMVEYLGQVTPAVLSELRQRASAVVFASRYENFPLTLLEALAQACPLVSSDAGSCTEIVTHERSALVFPAGDSEALAQRLELLLRHPERAAELAATGHADYRARFMPDALARVTLDFYEEVLAKRAARGSH